MYCFADSLPSDTQRVAMFFRLLFLFKSKWKGLSNSLIAFMIERTSSSLYFVAFIVTSFSWSNCEAPQSSLKLLLTAALKCAVTAHFSIAVYENPMILPLVLVSRFMDYSKAISVDTPLNFYGFCFLKQCGNLSRRPHITQDGFNSSSCVETSYIINTCSLCDSKFETT